MWMFVHSKFRDYAASLVQATVSMRDSVLASGVFFVAGYLAEQAVRPRLLGPIKTVPVEAILVFRTCDWLTGL